MLNIIHSIVFQFFQFQLFHVDDPSEVQTQAKQEHKAADEIVADDQPTKPPARNEDPEVKTVDDPTLLALVAPVPSAEPAAGEAAPQPEKIPDERSSKHQALSFSFPSSGNFSY